MRERERERERETKRERESKRENESEREKERERERESERQVDMHLRKILCFTEIVLLGTRRRYLFKRWRKVTEDKNITKFY